MNCERHDLPFVTDDGCEECEAEARHKRLKRAGVLDDTGQRAPPLPRDDAELDAWLDISF